MNYDEQKKEDVLCVDMKSFYASCEAILRGLDPMTAKIVVVGDEKRNGSVVLASSPKMKEIHHIKTGARLYEVKRINDPTIIIAQARMGYYYDMSMQVVAIFEQFTPKTHIHIYSVDESWLTITGSTLLWGTPRKEAEKIIDTIRTELGLVATVGIGDNKFLAKAALDLYAKHEENGIAEIRYKEVTTKLHPVEVGNMWGVGTQLKKRLNALGIFTIGDLAHTSEERIKEKFGKNGTTLWHYAWGLDDSPVVYDEANPPQSVFGFGGSYHSERVKSIGRGVTLLRDYVVRDEINVVIRNLIEEVCEKMRAKKVTGKTIHLSVGYSCSSKEKGFSKQFTLKLGPTNDPDELYKLCMSLLEKQLQPGEPVRTLRVSVGKFSKEESYSEEEFKRKKREIAAVQDRLNERFGKGTVKKATALYAGSVSKERDKKINGHFE